MLCLLCTMMNYILLLANGSCAVGQYKCKNIVPQSCINATLVGDGHADCADNSDEGIVMSC